MMTSLCCLSAAWYQAAQARAIDGIRIRLHRVAGGHTVLGDRDGGLPCGAADIFGQGASRQAAKRDSDLSRRSD
jgi:hypothetical protein